MMNFNKIFEESNNINNFIVVSSKIKKNIIELKSKKEIENKKLYNFKVISDTELIDLLSFTIDNEVLMDNLANYKRPSSITKELINFSKFNLENKNEILTAFTVENEKYIERNPFFIDKINDCVFHLIGQHPKLDSFIKFYNLNVIKHDISSNNSPIFLKFNSKEDELFYIFERISKLLKQGVNIGNIFLTNIFNTDYNVINKLSSFYNIPVIINPPIKLINIPYISKLLSLEYNELLALLNNNDELIEYCYESYIIDKDDFNKNINHLITIFNKYPYFNYDDNIAYTIIKEDVKNKNINDGSYSNGIKIIDLDEVLTLSSDDFVFIINAKYEFFPVLEKDSSYLSDSEKEIINYPTSTIMNLSNNFYLEQLIKLEQVKYVSFSLKDSDGEYTASDIFSKMTTANYPITNITESLLTDGFAKDYYRSYFINNHEGVLQSTFDPSFKINADEQEVMNEYIRNKDLKLSPTDITTYIQLPFVYYLEKIIGLSTFKESTSLNLGNFFHTIIEVLFMIFFETKVDRSKNSDNNKFSRDEEVHKKIFDLIIELGTGDLNEFDYNQYFVIFYNIYFQNDLNKLEGPINLAFLKENSLSIRTLFYIKKHQETIVRALELLINLEQTIESEELIIEKGYELENLKGKADLIKVYDNNTYSIIDYKTGNREAFNVSKIDELLDSLLENANTEISFGSLNLLQLVLYSYILSKENENLKLKDLAYYSYFTEKLNGITTKDFNPEFYTNTKTRLITSEELEELFTKIETLLNNTIESIYNIDFNTNIRRDEKSKQGLDSSFYSIYEALIYFSEEVDISEDEDN